MKVVHISTETEFTIGKKLPMDKDKRFLAQLRTEIIADHNKKILLKQKKQA